jgi:DNA-binding MarR family transcriptional regulator
MATVLELIRVHRILLDRIDRALRPLDLTFARYEILMLLSFTRRGGLSIGSLGRLLQVHTTSVTSAVDRLESDGLVGRIRSDRDRREVMVRITQQGRSIASTATETLNANVFTALGLSPSQGTQLWSLLRAFRANAGDFDVVADRARRTG